MLKFSKAEKVVLIGGIIVILLIVALGFAKKTLIDNKKEPFKVPESAETTTTSKKEEPKESDIKGIKLKKSTFVVGLNKKLSEKVSTYVEASDDIMKEIEIDFSHVDMTKAGEYTAKLTYKNDSIDIPIVVKDTTAPVITVANAQVVFTLEPTSTLEELITFVNATAEDDVDGVIASDQITGWPKELSDKNETVTYTLKVKDSSGNEGKKDITVQYIVPTTENTTPSEE
ncbi:MULTISPECIES: hypothetical protein [Bacillota]|jgi:hypothetical protein|uniref:Uncharacterized protein n=2 Tax=Amedibacillus TaxID=2749846 RepID=A0A7G9GJV6_9FIRM|nr:MULTISPECIES: hypothetical protein [Bacillota]QNM11088.1 hypothetical protein H9Q80_12545 [[Eubacterium] hominis]MCH4286524.1 hypothetical protein [Amedibacillus hominis]RGB58635.1 hypothetical protein DW271_02845 [Absiella sp. AM22-9]RGB63465.1 hypothetical protein DW120_01585 [Absiella sp. AM10-20]RGB66189.1 hypothetical protein DW113_09785 [Absiella sp. AM09-45]